MNSFLHWKRTKPFENKAEQQRIVDELTSPGKFNLPEPPASEQEWQAIYRRIREKERVHAKNNTSILTLPRFAVGFATVCVLALLFVWFVFVPSGKEYVTGRAEKLTVKLADNSEVRLNCDSRLIVAKGFSAISRKVELAGEAYFNVEKGKHPFFVKTNSGTVTVVGTAFNIKERDNRIQIAVNEGVVKFSVEAAHKDSTITLTQDQYISCTTGSFPDAPQKIGFASFPGWLDGNISAKQSTFRQLCDEIERRFDVTIIINDVDLGNTEFSGLFDANDLHNLLQAVSVLVDKDYRIEKNTITFQ